MGQAGRGRDAAAHNPAYRLILKYFFFMQRLSNRRQWAVVVGLYIAYRIVVNVAREQPELRPWVMPLIVAYLVFFLASWLARPLANLTLRLHPFGRLALSKDERTATNWIGGFLLLAAVAGVAALAGSFLAIAVAIFFLAMLLPLATTFQSAAPWPRRGLVVYTALVGLLGVACLAVLLLPATPDVVALLYPMTMSFFPGAVLSSLAANILNSIAWKRVKAPFGRSLTASRY